MDSFGIAPRLVSTKEKFTQEKAPEVTRKRPSVIPGDPLLHTLVVPAKSTIGARLMKSMGWREGKGVGPTTADPGLKVYGCSLPGKDPAERVGVAPSDITSWDFSAKDNLHGIGYRGMSREHFVTSQYNKGVYGMSGQVRRGRGEGVNKLYIYMHLHVCVPHCVGECVSIHAQHVL